MNKTKTILSALAVCAIGVLIYIKQQPDSSTKTLSSHAEKQISHNTDWPIFRGVPSLSGRVDADLPDSFKRVWTFKSQDEIQSSPIIANGVIYFGSYDQHVYAVKLNDGSPLWSTKLDNSIISPCLYSDKMIYTGSEGGTMYALDSSTGKIQWKFETEGKLNGGPNIFSEENKKSIIFGSYDNNLYSLDAVTGTKQWTFESDNFLNGTPTVINGNALVGGCDQLLRVINLKTGKELRNVDVSSYIAASAAAEGDICYLGHHGEQVVAVNTQEGKIVWTFEDELSPDTFMGAPAVGDSSIYIGCKNNKVYCLDKATGSVQWQFSTKGEVASAPLLCNNGLVVCSTDGRVYILEPQSGKIKWKYEIGTPLSASPAIAQGYLVVADTNGIVHCFK